MNVRDLWEWLKRQDELELVYVRVPATILIGILVLSLIAFTGWILGAVWYVSAQSSIRADIAMQHHYCSIVWYNAFQCRQASFAVQHDKDRLLIASQMGLFIGGYLLATLMFSQLYWMWWNYGTGEERHGNEVLSHTINIATMQGSQQSSRNIAITIISMAQSVVTFVFVLIVLASFVGVAMSLI